MTSKAKKEDKQADLNEDLAAVAEELQAEGGEEEEGDEEEQDAVEEEVAASKQPKVSATPPTEEEEEGDEEEAEGGEEGEEEEEVEGEEERGRERRQNKMGKGKNSSSCHSAFPHGVTGNNPPVIQKGKHTYTIILLFSTFSVPPMTVTVP